VDPLDHAKWTEAAGKVFAILKVDEHDRRIIVLGCYSQLSAKNAREHGHGEQCP
jgi:hypothetical protein